MSMVSTIAVLYAGLPGVPYCPSEGDPCVYEPMGCPGVMGFRPVEDCRCHARPPCSACVENPLVCLTCGWDPEEEEKD